MVAGEADALDLDGAAGRGHLIADHLITGADDFVAVASADVAAGFDACAGSGACPISGIQFAVEANAEFVRSLSPGPHGLRHGLAGVFDFKNPALPFWTRTPVRRATVASDDEVALRTDAGIHGE